MKVVNGITITKSIVEGKEERDDQVNYMSRNISHLTGNPEFLSRLYKYRLSESDKQKVHSLFKDTFSGTKKYHNYTKDVKPDQQAANRFMLELSANEYMYVNQDSFKVTSSEDPRAIEFVKFYLKGQSFLYNQIRKMVGSII